MTMQKIKADKHGLYVSCNGAIHRPVPAIHRYVGTNSITGQSFDHTNITDGPHVFRGSHTHSYVRGTKYAEGDEVNVKNVNYTPYSNVGGELWTTHGNKYRFDKAAGKTRKVPTELCFQNGQIYVPDVDTPPLTPEELALEELDYAGGGCSRTPPPATESYADQLDREEAFFVRFALRARGWKK